MSEQVPTAPVTSQASCPRRDRCRAHKAASHGQIIVVSDADGNLFEAYADYGYSLRKTAQMQGAIEVHPAQCAMPEWGSPQASSLWYAAMRSLVLMPYVAMRTRYPFTSTDTRIMLLGYAYILPVHQY
eukprot:3757705-Rhodomonas_salina.3